MTMWMRDRYSAASGPHAHIARYNWVLLLTVSSQAVTSDCDLPLGLNGVDLD